MTGIGIGIKFIHAYSVFPNARSIPFPALIMDPSVFKE
jgi:hypothetical protein